VAQPVGIYVNTYGRSNVNFSDSEIAGKIEKIFDLRPAAIENRLGLRKPIYLETAAYGHMGRAPFTRKQLFNSSYHTPIELELNFFTWEELDMVDEIRKTFITD
jgi:S-adenosylmethionine synthetase